MNRRIDPPTGRTLRSIQVVAILLAIAWGATIWWVNGLPAEDLPPMGWSSMIPHFDKVVHFGMYAILSGFAWMATALGVRVGSRSWFAWGVVAILFPSTMGALDEWRQLTVPGRAASVYDWFADAAGAIAAVTILSVGHITWARWTANNFSTVQDRRDGLHREAYPSSSNR